MSSYAAYTRDINEVRSFDAEDCVSNPLTAPPEGCTTTPSLLLAAAKMNKFRCDLELAAEEARKASSKSDSHTLVSDICERFAVKVGVKLLRLLPQECRISAEVDVDSSCDTEASISKASQILSLYEQHGISKERVLVKLALSWESIQACKALENRGIHCSMALLQHQHYKRDGKRLQAFISKVLKLSTSSQTPSEAAPIQDDVAVEKEVIQKQAKATAACEGTGFSMKMLQRSGSSNSVLSTECPTLPEHQDDASTTDDTSTSDEDSPSSASIEVDCDAAEIAVTEGKEARQLTQHDLEHLRSFAARSMTAVESGTEHGDASASFTAEECVNDPSLLLAAAKMGCFRYDLKQAATEAKELDAEAVIGEICERFALKVGVRLLELRPEQDCIAMQVDSDLRFDTEASVAKASKILNMYAAEGIPKERIMIKLAPSWEAIQACKLLESRNICCDMSLLQHQNSEKDTKQLRSFIRKVLKL